MLQWNEAHKLLIDTLPECPAGYHGVNCDLRCGACADNVTCDSMSGVCAGDCQDGYLGDQCKVGTFFLFKQYFITIR